MHTVATTEEKAPSRKERQREARDEARRQLALSQVRRYPDPALRQEAREVEEFSDDLKVLSERMGRIMKDADGVGLAGPQLGLLRRILVFRARDEDDITTLVNPVITSQGEETESDVEGCLSLPNVAVPVDRPVSIVVEAKDVEGNPLHLELNGFPARVVQHEMDHLNGVLIFDRTTDEARKTAMAALRPTPGAL
jgi:peptide deformylase